MMYSTVRTRIQVETVGGVTVAGFGDEALLSEEVIRDVEEQLFHLHETVGPGSYLVSFRGVRFLSSTMLAVLIKFARRIEKSGGALRLCGLAPHLREVFRVSRFDRLLSIHETEAQALDAFEKAR